MKRRLASLLATTLAAATLAALAPASPASADTNVCAFTGSANTSPIFYPVSVTPGTLTTTSRTVTVLAPTFGFFSIHFGGLGVCLPGPKSLTATGTISGWCGHSSGSGVTGQGHRFAWVEAGSLAVITGEVTGVAQVQPDPFVAGNSCLTGATTFQVTGAAVLTHCSVTKTKVTQSVTIPVPGTHNLTSLGTLGSLHVTTQPANLTYNVKVCI